MERYSNSYVGTFNYECADDMLRLEDLKCMVRNMNRMLREDGRDYQFRVVLRGRKPAEKQVINTMPWGSGMRRMKEVSYDYFGNIVGGIANATRVDAYIYRRF